MSPKATSHCAEECPASARLHFPLVKFSLGRGPWSQETLLALLSQKKNANTLEALPRIPIWGLFWNVLTSLLCCVYSSRPMATLQSALPAYHYLASSGDMQRSSNSLRRFLLHNQRFRCFQSWPCYSKQNKKGWDKMQPQTVTSRGFINWWKVWRQHK